MEPLIELCSGFEPVRTACWSPNNSCIIASTTKSYVEIWNIRQNLLRPAAKRRFDAGSAAITVCRFTKCGRSLVVGDGDGSTHMCALEDMPFPPHFQYHELQNAIYHGLNTQLELQRQVMTMGYLGYPPTTTTDQQRA